MLEFSNSHKEKYHTRIGRDRLFSFPVISTHNWYKNIKLFMNYKR